MSEIEKIQSDSQRVSPAQKQSVSPPQSAPSAAKKAENAGTAEKQEMLNLSRETQKKEPGSVARKEDPPDIREKYGVFEPPKPDPEYPGVQLKYGVFEPPKPKPEPDPKPPDIREKYGVFEPPKPGPEPGPKPPEDQPPGGGIQLMYGIFEPPKSEPGEKPPGGGMQLMYGFFEEDPKAGLELFKDVWKEK